MRLEFAKLHGLGNDFVFIDNLDGSIELDDKKVKQICDRHFGIGADGVILVSPTNRDECEAYMHYINSDGTLAQMCGNGVRCFAKYLVDRKLVDPDGGSFIADTLAGPRPITFKVDANGLLANATVNMGEPILNPLEIPINAEANMRTSYGVPFVGNTPIESPWHDFEFTAVSMGNPHAITFIDNWNDLPDQIFKDSANKCLETLDVDMVGSFYEGNPVFPEKSNIEFAEIVPDGIKMRVYERGCGETYACGTGACATSVAACITGRSGADNIVHLLGGDLAIEWPGFKEILMSGPATESFSGVIEV